MPYSFIELDKLSYQFSTDHGIVYDANFVDYSFLFPEYPEFSKDVYTFNLEVVKGNIYEQAMDAKIAKTVIAIFLTFFNSKQNIVIYICDTTDDRQFARKRKFDTWFWRYNDGSFLKEDGLAVISDVPIYNSLLVHKQNKYIDSIIKAFQILNERANEK